MLTIEEKNKIKLGSNIEEANILFNEVIAKLISVPEIHAIWLFGSFVDGTNDKFSDLDFKISINEDFYTAHGKVGFDKLVQSVRQTIIWRRAGFADYTAFCHYEGVSYTLRVDYHFYFDKKPVPRVGEKSKLLFSRANVDNMAPQKQRTIFRGVKLSPEELIKRYWLKQLFNLKFIARKQLWDVLSFIQGERAHLITILRNIYTPDKIIYYLRDIESDFPKEVVNQLKKTVVTLDYNSMVIATQASFDIAENYIKPYFIEKGWNYPEKAANKVIKEFNEIINNKN